MFSLLVFCTECLGASRLVLAAAIRPSLTYVREPVDEWALQLPSTSQQHPRWHVVFSWEPLLGSVLWQAWAWSCGSTLLTSALDAYGPISQSLIFHLQQRIPALHVQRLVNLSNGYCLQCASAVACGVELVFPQIEACRAENQATRTLPALGSFNLYCSMLYLDGLS